MPLRSLAAAAVTLAALAGAPAAEAAWSQGVVFWAGEPHDVRGFVDRAGAVRWSAAPSWPNGAPRPGRAQWRTRTPQGRPSPPVALASVHPTLEVDGAGRGLAMWPGCGTPARLCVRRRAPSGAPLGPPFAVSQPSASQGGFGGRAFGIGGEVDDAGNAVFLWMKSGAPGAFFRVMHADGRLEPPEALPAADPGSAVVRVGPDGSLALAWTEHGRIVVMTGSTSGRRDPPRPIPMIGEPPQAFATEVGPAGTAVVAWVQGARAQPNGNFPDLRGDLHVAAARAGAPFVAQRLSAGRAPAVPPGLAIATTGAAMVTWAEASPTGTIEPGREHTAIAAAYAPDGVSFGATGRLARSPDAVGFPVVAFDDGGDAVVAWEVYARLSVVAALFRAGRGFERAARLGHGTGLHAAGGGQRTLVVSWLEGNVASTAIRRP